MEDIFQKPEVLRLLSLARTLLRQRSTQASEIDSVLGLREAMIEPVCQYLGFGKAYAWIEI